MILIIDNYDSFVYNLARYFREMGCATTVRRNDAMRVADVERMAPHAIVISPGPCTPSQAGISVELVQSLSDSIPILGVCLGHQAIGEAFGSRIARAVSPVHGVRWLVRHESSALFAGLPNPFWAGRYHSLCVPEESLADDLRITGRTDDGVVMAIEHATRPVFGVQFHPESILTEFGHRILANFLSIAGVPFITPFAGDSVRTPELSETFETVKTAGMPIYW